MSRGRIRLLAPGKQARASRPQRPLLVVRGDCVDDCEPDAPLAVKAGVRIEVALLSGEERVTSGVGGESLFGLAVCSSLLYW